MEPFDFLFPLLFCFVLPVGLAVWLFVWLGRRARRSADTSVAPRLAEQAMLDAFDRLVDRWAAAGRLAPALAEQLRALLAEERLARAGVTFPSAGSGAWQDGQDAPGALPRPEAAVAPAAAAADRRPKVPWSERIGAAILSLRTRQTLLFLGSFLLVISALILIVFNWASFPPILQFALLAGVCAGFWGGGAWLARSPGLARAGAGLEIVGGVLVPIVAFSLSRPGLLDLAPRGAWLLTSAASLLVYLLASWRQRRLFFVVAASLSAANAVLASLGPIESQWLPLALVLALACYLPLVAWLRRRAPDLARGPEWVAHAGVPGALVAAVLALDAGALSASALAAALWAGAGFYLLAARLDRRLPWSWAAAALPLAGLPLTLRALDASAPWWGVAPAVLALAYLGLALALESRARRDVSQCYVGAAGLALMALAPLSASPQSARWTLPLLLLGALALTLAYHRGRLAWLSEPSRLSAATLGLIIGGLLLPAWALALLDLTALTVSQHALALLPLAGLYAVGGYAWPGRLRRSYDLSLQLLGIVLAVLAGTATLAGSDMRAIGMVALTAFWALQIALRRHWVWAAAALGNALLAASLLVARVDAVFTPDHWIALALGFAASYLLGGAILRGSRWRFVSWPALGWGALVGSGALLAILLGILDSDQVLARHVAATLVLAATIALAGRLWRAAWTGYLVAALLALAAMLAATRGFFTAWQPAAADYAYVLCALTLGMLLVGQGLRRLSLAYAYPYEVAGYALLMLAPLPAAESYSHSALTWAAMALLYALAIRLYRLRWAAAPALLAADLALLNTSAWLAPSGRPAGAGALLLAAAWAQGLIGLWSARRAKAVGSAWLERLQPGYVVAALSGLGALLIAASASDVLALVALGLFALLALTSTIHRRAEGAWGALALLALGLGSLHVFWDTGLPWSLAWGVAEALALCLVGWLLETIKRSHVQMFSAWRTPLWLGPLLAGAGLSAALLAAAPLAGSLPPLTFGVATLGLLLATLAVRRRSLDFAYAAGSAFVAAGLCQLYDWGFRQPQPYVIPSGLYLLALSAGLRRFQGRHQLSQVGEAAALVLLLGVTFGQSLAAGGLESQLYGAMLCVEALLVLGYGLLARLRVPFLGGAGFFVAGVLWLSVDPLLSANKWVLLGILGLVLVAVYVLLERRQEQLARAGRAWVERVSQWG